MLVACAGAALAGNVGETIQLKATDFGLATGNPSLVMWKKGATYVPVWSLSGGQVGQSVAAITPPLPADCAGVRVELLVLNEESSANDSFTDVYRAHLAQIIPGQAINAGETVGKPVRSRLAAKPGLVRTIVLEGYRIVVPGAPLAVRIQREPDDPGDTYTRPAGLIAVNVTPLAAPPKPLLVEGRPGYNSWPMIAAIGNKLVCTYSRGSAHTINEGVRDAYARTSMDGGRTWTPEVCFAADPKVGEVMIGKGRDASGAALFWVRCCGPKSHHDLYRTADGVTFERIATPTLSPYPMQITDIFSTKRGLMCLWFATNYSEKGPHHWGTLASADNGHTWVQKTVETLDRKGELPTEPCVLPLADGRLFGLARTEGGGDSLASEFQLTSLDGGETWKKERTNIRDVMASTPSLVYDAQKGTVSAYYYERGRRVIKRRTTRVADVFDNPLAWPAPEGVVLGDEERPHDAGNVNAIALGGTHYLSYYSGTKTDTAVYVAPVAAR